MSRVQSIERAFAVLGALTDGPIGVTEVADRVDLPKSTAARMLASLAREGAVEQLPGETRYRLGPRIEELAAGLLTNRSVVAIARPHLVELAASIGEVAGLSVPEGDLIHYVDQVDSAESGGRPRLDRGADCASRGFVRPGGPGPPTAGPHRRLPGPKPGALHGSNDDRARPTP